MYFVAIAVLFVIFAIACHIKYVRGNAEFKSGRNRHIMLGNRARHVTIGASSSPASRAIQRQRLRRGGVEQSIHKSERTIHFHIAGVYRHTSHTGIIYS